jgi:adenylate cyclase
LGTGINTGVVTVGLMGSNAHILNYTIFGREVNLASRLEGVSGHGRIVIGEGTYAALQREDPALARSCIELEPTKPKGFQKPVRNFEVPWQTGSETTAAA